MLTLHSKKLRIVCLALIAALAGCARDGMTFLHPYGPVAAAQRHWLIEDTLWMLIVIVPVFVLLPAFAWRYRRRNVSAAYRPNWEFALPLEFLVWGAPVAVVAVLASIIITSETPLGPYRPVGGGTPLEIDVVALNWKWLFIYPEQHVATVGEVVLPEKRPVRFRLTSDATMQSFFIPSLGSQIYAMAGMVTSLNLIADRTGTLTGENTQFNGMQFQNDKFQVDVLPRDAFSAWIDAQSRAPRTLDATTYAVLAQWSTTAEARRNLGIPLGEPFALRAEPGAFAGIVAKYHPGGMPAQLQQEAQGGR